MVIGIRDEGTEAHHNLSLVARSQLCVISDLPYIMIVIICNVTVGKFADSLVIRLSTVRVSHPSLSLVAKGWVSLDRKACDRRI